MTHFHLYRADCIGRETNCEYPHTVDVTDEESLREAVWQDYVAAEYQDHYRNEKNFLGSDCLALDCDNDHSENPATWATPETILAALPGVTVGFHFSRHHNQPKKGKSARPRFHCLFRIDPMTDAEAYKKLKEQMHKLFPYYDNNAIDSARFFFGTEKPEVMLHEGTVTLNKCLEDYYSEDPFTGLPDAGEVIPEGSRNSTMHLHAVRLLKRFGPSDEAEKLYLERAEKCEPPLEEKELKTIWQSAMKFYKGTIATQAGYVKPQDYGKESPGSWEEPIPFSEIPVARFPLEALPAEIANYVAAVAESTQTPVDMAGTVALAVLSVCLQAKYRVKGKDDWSEPLNTYTLVIAAPSERKSAVQHLMLQPINSYENEYNKVHAGSVESSKMRRRVLERRQKTIEDQVAKGKATEEELTRIAEEIANFEEETPLKLFVDDITMEKLVSVMAASDGRAAMLSSEGGIFDTLAGIYTKNVNIDVILKGYSGDPIRVDRIGRASENIESPALTVSLMAQPSVISTVLTNPIFNGRGLTARFLYSMPKSQVGSRRFRSETIQPDVFLEYNKKITDLLEDEYPETPEIIRLSPEAGDLLNEFAEDLEPRLIGDCAEIAEWAGKLVGTVLRISGLLCRAGVCRNHDFPAQNKELTVDADTMAGAIRLGMYFLLNAQTVFDVLPSKTLVNQANRILEMITEKKLTSFDRRTALRFCRTFKTVAEIQPVLDFLEDYGYIAQLPPPEKVYSAGRPPQPKYLVNPLIDRVFCHACPNFVTAECDKENA